MSELKLPSIGRIVHYFAGANSMPQAAIVVQGGDLAPCLSVFQKDEVNPVMFKWSVQHKTAVLHYETGEPQSHYWDWPEIK